MTKLSSYEFSSCKEQYRHLISLSSSVPIFAKDWWLDSVVGEQTWQASYAFTDDRLVAIITYGEHFKYGRRMTKSVSYTPYIGPWIDREAQHSLSVSQMRDVKRQLVTNIGSFSKAQLTLCPQETDGYVFSTLGFEVNVKFTYILNTSDSIHQVWKKFAPGLKSDIKRAKNKHGLKIALDANVSDLIALNTKVFERQGIGSPYKNLNLNVLLEHAIDKKCGKIIAAADDSGRVVSCVFVVWDNETMYYLMSGTDPQKRGTGGLSLCLWEAINEAAEMDLKFDFEGSMIDGIEKYFRSFGGKQTPYYVIKKTNGKAFKLLEAFRMALKE
jgi:hypothetical protein